MSACGARVGVCVCVCTRVRARTRSFCAKQGYGIQPRPAFLHGSVQLEGIPAVSLCVCVCVRGGGVGDFVWTEWTLISRLISPKGSAGERWGLGGGTAALTFLSS